MTSTDDRAPRTWLRLWLLGVAALFASAPYFHHLVATALARAPIEGAPPVPVLLALQLAQTAVLLLVACAAGAWCARHVGLRAPVVAGDAPLRSIGLLPVAIGAGTGVVVVAFAVAMRAAFPGALPGEDVAAPWWLGLFTPFYGGVVEELLVRWLLVSAIALGLTKLRAPRPAAAAVVVAALVFGLGHLPAAAALGLPLSAPLVVYVLVGNGAAGLVFGALYVRRGLEAAMVAHAVTDVALHVVGPLLA